MSLLIATPAYQGTVKARYALSLLWTSHALTEAGVRHKPLMFCDAPVNVARNRLAATFMAGDWSHLLFIDYDIEWKPGSVLRLLSATQHEQIGVAVGVYPKRCRELRFPVNFVSRDGRPVIHAQTGYVELRDATTGFMLIRRDVIERMMAAYPDRKCSLQEQPHPCPAEEPFEFDLFPFLIDGDRQFLTEDFGFCRLWQRLGGRVWADPEIELNHDGYTGSIRSLLEIEPEGAERVGL